MKKTLLSSILLVSLMLMPVMALAYSWGDWGWGDWGGAPSEAPTLDIMDTLDNIADWLFAILLIVAAIFIIIAGYFFVTAAGDPDKTKRARDFVMYALVGVLVGFVAKGLVMLVGQIVM